MNQQPLRNIKVLLSDYKYQKFNSAPCWQDWGKTCTRNHRRYNSYGGNFDNYENRKCISPLPQEFHFWKFILQTDTTLMKWYAQNSSLHTTCHSKQLLTAQCLSTRDWLSELWDVSTAECDAAMEKNEKAFYTNTEPSPRHADSWKRARDRQY